MPFFLETDNFHVLPQWEVLSEGVADVIDRLQSALQRLKSEASHLLSNGYLTEAAALRLCRNRQKILDLLCTSVLEEKPFVHRQGDECECLGDTWIDGYAFKIHNFLKRNPSRREYNRNQHQKADLRNAALKDHVYRRDGGCCRYCTSGPLSPKAGRSKDRRKILTFDHVDPDAIAGEQGENLVVACARCNEEKGHRTPEEADLVLLPVPSPEQAQAMRHRDRQLADRPAALNQAAINDQPAPNQQNSDQKQDREQKPITDPISDHQLDPITDHSAPARPEPIQTSTDHRADQGSEGSGLGRGGTPDLVPRPAAAYPGQPERTSDSPDIYHRRSRPAPPAHISAIPEWPPTNWPAGSVPATPTHDEHTGGTP